MAKKNTPKDPSGVFFDTHSKMVMSQGGTFERMKEKIHAVRAVVPNKSNNEISLVLQHFENSVDKAVQAFLEGNATEILKEWNVTGKKKPKKKKKPKPEAPPPAEAAAPVAEAPPAPAGEGEGQKGALNGFHGYGSAMDGESLDSLSEQLDTASLDTEVELDSEPAAASETTGTEVEGSVSSPSPALPPSGGRTAPPPKGQRVRHRPGYHGQQPPAAPASNVDTLLRGSSGTKKQASNIERSVKDLQRCNASLTRYRVVVKDEMDSSIKCMKQTFAELQSCLMDREVTLFAEMDKVKAEAIAILDGRQKKAEELWRLADKSASMTEDQLTELRADIKHFVSERKYDEELGKALKFSFELEPLKTGITEFGSVYHPSTSYSTRSRCSSTSSITAPEAPPPSHPPTPSNDYRPPPNKQTFQGNRRTFQGPGYHSGGPRGYTGGSYQDRNPGRSNYRYQGNGAQQGDGPRGGGTGGTGSQHPSASRPGGPLHPSPSPSNYQRQDRPARNGLP